MAVTSRVSDTPIRLPTERVGRFDPAPELARLRETCPLSPLRYADGHVGWLATSHGLARTILADQRFSMHPPRSPVDDSSPELGYEPEMAGVVLFADPPEHTRLRRLQTGYFTVRRVGEHREAIEQIVGGCLDVMAQTGPPVDLVQSFALPVPSMTICELLGVPHAERDRFERPNAVMAEPLSSGEQKAVAMHEFLSYAHGVIASKRDAPGRDLLSELILTGELSDDELAGLAFTLFSAGHDTTSNLLGLGAFALLSDRTRWETLRSDPSVIEGAVEELLRYLSIQQLGAFTRTAIEDIELEGVVIRAGQSVTVSLPAANRDPARFADPDRFDPCRDTTGHVAFGHGRHMCLGQHLARLEARIALTELVRRFPGLRLAVSADQVPMHTTDQVIYGVHALPVAW